MLDDKSLKKIQIDLLDQQATKIQGKICTKSVLVTENDIINLDAIVDGKLKNIHGQIIKIGTKNKKIYITIILYNYYEKNNVLMIYIDDIRKINNINRNANPISFASVLCADESVVLLRTNNLVFEYSPNGKDWYPVAGEGSQAEIGATLTGIYQLLTDNYGLSVTFETFLSTLAKLINMFAEAPDEDNNIEIVTRHITDLDGNVIIAGENL